MVFMKKIALFLILPLITACSSTYKGNIDDATILNWENETVTQEQFIKDHKECLGVNRDMYEPRSKIARLIQPNIVRTVPEWSGLWATFQSNEYQGVGQRVLLSAPSNMSSNSIGVYRKCMFSKGYLLRAS
jgi:hypothetical protein